MSNCQNYKEPKMPDCLFTSGRYKMKPVTVNELPQDVSTGTWFKATVYARGIKKRCRNTDFHSFDLGYLPYPFDVSDEAWILDHAAKHAKANMRQITGTCYLKLLRVEIDDDQGPFRSLSFQMFDKRHEEHSLNHLV